MAQLVESHFKNAERIIMHPHRDAALGRSARRARAPVLWGRALRAACVRARACERSCVCVCVCVCVCTLAAPVSLAAAPVLCGRAHNIEPFALD